MLLLMIPLFTGVFSLAAGKLFGIRSSKFYGFCFALSSLLSLIFLFGMSESAPVIGDLFFDGLGKLFSILVLFIGIFIGVFAAGYMHGYADLHRFFLFLNLFQVSMLGLLSSQNWVSLIVFWELISVVSFFLIATDSSSESAQKAARRSLMVTAAGGLGLMLAAVVSYAETGSWMLSAMHPELAKVSAHALSWIFFGVVFAVCTKSAQMPFHFWLPGAMKAPTPVSAYLHSATLVKAGIFLLFKFYPVLSLSQYWFVLSWIGLLTYVVSGWIAVGKTQMKELLAYSTISQLGLIVVALGIQSPAAVVAALLHVLAHALFKAPLFMSVGVEKSPRTAATVFFAVVSLMAVPLSFGFLSKENILKSLLLTAQNGGLDMVFPLGVFLGSVASVLYSFKLLFGIYAKTDSQNSSKNFLVWLPAFLMVLVSVILGFFPEFLQSIVVSALLVVVGASGASQLSFHIVPKLDLALLLSGLSLCVGIALYFAHFRSKFAKTAIKQATQDSALGARFEQLFYALHQFGFGLANIVQGKFLHHYLRLTTAIIALACVYPFYKFSKKNVHEWLFGIPILADQLAIHTDVFLCSVIVFLLLAFSLLPVFLRKKRYWPVIFSLSGMGLMVVALFYFLGAPDLALTQALIETVSISLFAGVLGMAMKKERQNAKTATEDPLLTLGNGFRLLVALAVGVVSFFAAWSMLQIPQHAKTASLIYGQISYFFAAGKNIVNVILVDFRGFDTLGEIFVFGAGAIGFSLVLQRLKAHGFLKNSEHTEKTWTQYWAVFLIPVLVQLSLYLAIRGHNQPGGGFVAGLCFAVGFLILKNYWPQKFSHQHPLMNGPMLIGIGFGIALLSAMAPVALGDAVFRSYMWSTFSTATFFDFGVMALVAGTTLVLAEEA